MCVCSCKYIYIYTHTQICVHPCTEHFAETLSPFSALGRGAGQSRYAFGYRDDSVPVRRDGLRGGVGGAELPPGQTGPDRALRGGLGAHPPAVGLARPWALLDAQTSSSWRPAPALGRSPSPGDRKSVV